MRDRGERGLKGENMVDEGDNLTGESNEDFLDLLIHFISLVEVNQAN